MPLRSELERFKPLLAAVQRALPKRLLALEWDAREARFVAGAVSGGRLTIEHAVRLPLPAVEEGAAPAAPLGELIRTALGVHRVGRAQLLLAAPRSSVDLRQLTLPPVQKSELPELVRNQAVRELSAMQDGAVLDFTPLEDGAADVMNVLAAALPPDVHAAMQTVCRDLRRTAGHCALRPFAAASLWRRQQPDDPRMSLLVDAAADEAELTVVRRGEVIFSRAARLPAAGGDEGPWQPLLSEIRRTITAVSNQPGLEQGIEAICIFGQTEEYAPLVELLTEDVRAGAEAKPISVEVCDPFEQVELADDVARFLPANRGRFAALVGLLLDAAQGRQPLLDFLHPRRPAAAPNRTRQYAAPAGLVAAALLGGVYFVGWRDVRALDQQIRVKNKESAQLDEDLKQAQAQEEAAAAIQQWLDGETVWLDELRDLSARFPKRRDAVLLRLSVGRSPTAGGQMELQGLVRDPSIVGRMEGNLRDDHHEVRSKRVQENIREKTFTWQFESSLGVHPRTREEYLTAFEERSASGDTASGGDPTASGGAANEAPVAARPAAPDS